MMMMLSAQGNKHSTGPDDSAHETNEIKLSAHQDAEAHAEDLLAYNVHDDAH